MKDPIVSICIVTYNHEDYIHDCIMSVISQAIDTSIEILIGDDNSSDKTEFICQRLETLFPETIHFFRHDKNLGPSGNYQFLIDRARGEFIAHLDGDDFLLPGKLKDQLRLLKTNRNLSAVYTNALCIDESGSTIGVFNNAQPEIFDLNYLLERGNFLNNSSMMYRSEFKDTFLEWEEEFIDYKIHLHLASKGYLGYINRLGVGYRVSSVSSMVAHQGDSVRSRYWNALQYSTTLIDDATVLSSAEADFLRRALSRAIRTKSLFLFWRWAKMVFSETTQNSMRIILKLVVNTAVTAMLEAISVFCARVNGSGVKVMYWR